MIINKLDLINNSLNYWSDWETSKTTLSLSECKHAQRFRHVHKTRARAHKYLKQALWIHSRFRGLKESRSKTQSRLNRDLWGQMQRPCVAKVQGISVFFKRLMAPNAFLVFVSMSLSSFVLFFSILWRPDWVMYYYLTCNGLMLGFKFCKKLKFGWASF